MARVPIIHVGDTLIATVLEDLNDRDALALHEDMGGRLEQTGVRGVILDLTAVEIVDSFLGRLLNDLAVHTQLMGARTVVVGIQPAVAIATTLALTQGLKVFDQVQAMTRGGPYGATDTLSTVIYKETFANANFGYGAALSLVFTVLVLVAAAAQLFLTRDRSAGKK